MLLFSSGGMNVSTDKHTTKTKTNNGIEKFDLSTIDLNGSDNNKKSSYTSLGALVGSIIKFLAKTIGSLSILGICIGGVMWVISAGEDAQLETAKGIIISSVIGLIITLSAYLIVTFVQGVLYGIGGT